MRVTRDVWLRQNERGEFVVISRTPASVDEHLTLTLTSSAGYVDLHLQVVESTPVVVDGALRHQLKLRRTQAQEDARV